MSAAKFTPGPWAMETVRTSCGVCHKVGPFPGKLDDDKPRHACLYADYPSANNPNDVELEANARLIAAAPELLEACQTLADWLAREDDHAIDFYARVDLCNLAQKQVLAAIAKATGETS